MLLFDESRGLRPDAHVAREFLFQQQSRIQAVVKVVAVIGDFIGEIGDLCFE